MGFGVCVGGGVVVRARGRVRVRVLTPTLTLMTLTLTPALMTLTLTLTLTRLDAPFAVRRLLSEARPATQCCSLSAVASVL